MNQQHPDRDSSRLLEGEDEHAHGEDEDAHIEGEDAPPAEVAPVPGELLADGSIVDLPPTPPPPIWGRGAEDLPDPYRPAAGLRAQPAYRLADVDPPRRQRPSRSVA